MNRIGRKYSKCFSIAVLSGAFVIASEMPLLASPFPQQSAAQTPSQQPAPAPSGAAGAKAATVKGSPVAQPAGAAVAPARQRGHRSLLLKLGLVAGAGIAVGSVVALSERSPARPPGASSSTSTHP
jgi:predicted lipid-binding transport protein (Tim44 family)